MNVEGLKQDLKRLDITIAGFYLCMFVWAVGMSTSRAYPEMGNVEPFLRYFFWAAIVLNIAYTVVLSDLAGRLGRSGLFWAFVALFVPFGTLIGYSKVGGEGRGTLTKARLDALTARTDASA